MRNPYPEVLSSRHHTVIMYKVRGLTYPKIADLTGYSVARIQQIVSSKAGKEYERQLITTNERLILGDPIYEVKHELDRLAMPAVQRIAKLMNGDPSSRIQLNAANSLLDRTVPRKIQQAPPPAQFVLPPKVADRLLKVLQETAKLESAVDVTPEPADDPDSGDPT